MWLEEEKGCERVGLEGCERGVRGWGWRKRRGVKERWSRVQSRRREGGVQLELN